MQPSARKLAATVLAASISICVLCASLAAASAQAQIAFTPCGNSNNFACGHLTVPLDPSGNAPGTITLAMRRHRAPVGEAHSAIIALAGGPGQPALPFAEEFAELLGPIAATRDLIVFDQRGIGLSAPLSCHAFERPDLYRSFGAELEACASQLGPARTYYTTADTVADIEAIREAGGYEKLVLYGTSYGTKVAELYAQDYPSHVEALVLDSVVPPNGPEPLNRSTFAAVPRILRQLCAAHVCADVTRNPVADLARVVGTMTRGALYGRAISREGRAQTIPLSANELLGLLLAGDFSPPLRAEFVTAVAADARGDAAPLARLIETAAQAEGESEDFDTPLYYATTCEEQAFPFNRAATPKQRIAQALAAAKALPASAFAPFVASNALALSDIPACAYWPYTTPGPVLDQAPLPAVPTLILSGADDLRTPTSNAREVAAEIPGSHLLVVPYTGHSVLTDEQTSCASEALQALFAQKPVKQCPPAPVPASLRPPPPPPTRIGARITGTRLPRPARTHAARSRAHVRRLRPPARLRADAQRWAGKRRRANAQLRRPALRLGAIRRGRVRPAPLLLHPRRDALRHDRRRRREPAGRRSRRRARKPAPRRARVARRHARRRPRGPLWRLPCERDRNGSYCRRRCAGELKLWL